MGVHIYAPILWAESLQRYTGYEDVIITDDKGRERRGQKENAALRYKGDYTMELLWLWMSVFQRHGTNGCVYSLE